MEQSKQKSKLTAIQASSKSLYEEKANLNSHQQIFSSQITLSSLRCNILNLKKVLKIQVR